MNKSQTIFYCDKGKCNVIFTIDDEGMHVYCPKSKECKEEYCPYDAKMNIVRIKRKKVGIKDDMF